MGVIERRRGVALYVEVQDRIEALVRAEGLGPGDALPGETEFQTRFGVSRATIRQALAELERRGVVERRQGRGTFLTLPPMERALPELTGFTEHTGSRGLRPSGHLLDYGHRLACADDETHPFPPGSPLVRAVRVRSANDVVVGLHTVHVPSAIAEAVGFTEERLRAEPGASFYALLDAGGVLLTWAEERLSARVAGPEEAAVLGAAVGAPIRRVVRVSRDDRDRVVEVVRADYLGSRYDYVVHLERRADRGVPRTPAAVGGRAGGTEVG